MAAGDPKADSVGGGCFCGAVRFEIDLPTSFCAHCHCSMCRRIHGAPYVTWLGVPRSQLRIGARAEALRTFDSSPHGKRSFCGACGSPLFCELSERPDVVDIPLASLDEPIDRAPQMHVFYDDRADWVGVEDGLPQLGGESGMEPIPEVKRGK